MPLWTRKRLEQTHVCRKAEQPGQRQLHPAPPSSTPTTRHLARVPELGRHGSAHSLVHISTVEHDEGGVATQLHGDFLHGVGGHFQQQLKKSPAVILGSFCLRQQGATPSELLTLPVAVEPVKEILATSGWVHRTSPTDGVFALEQGTTLTTPGGIPACSAS